MLSLLKQEYSIILRKKTTYILIAITIISAILLPILSFQTFEYTFVNNTGEKIKENGISAIIKANELQKPIAGKVDSELINESLNVYYKSLNSEDGKINWNEEFTIYKPVNENLLYYLIEDFKERNIGKEETINSISNNYYDLRKDMQKKGFAEILNQNEQVYGEMLENKVDEPYTFEPHNGWDMYIMFLSYFFKISMVVSIIFISPLFTESKENNSMDIIYATKNGKMKYKIIRLFTSVSFSCLLSILGVVIYLIAGRFVLNYDGLKTSVQLIQLFSPQPINIGRLLFEVISFGLIGVLSVSNITAYCSYKLQKGRNVGLIMIGSFIIYIILNGLVNIPGDLGKTLFDLIPFRASDIYFILLEGVSASKILITLGNEKILLFMLLLYVVVANFKIIKCNK